MGAHDIRKPGESSDQAVRERLSQAALELFTARGYAATSVREIVEGAGVTKPVLYYYFGNKEGLYLSIMEGVAGLYEAIVADLSGFEGSARQRIFHFFTGMFDAVRENLTVVRLIYAIFFGPPQGAPPYDFHRFFDGMLEIVGSFLKKGMENGEFGRCAIRPMTWALVGCFNTIIEEQFCHEPPRVDRQGLVETIEAILAGIDLKREDEK